MKAKNIFWFCVINFLLLCLLSLRYYAVSGFVGGFWGVVFTPLFIFGHLSMFAAGLFIFNFLFSLIGAHAAKASCVLSASFLTSLLLTDILVYKLYRFHISMSMLELFFGPAGREIFVFPPSMYALVIAAGLFILFLEFCFLKLSLKINFGKKAITAVSVLVLLSVILYNGVYAWGKFMAAAQITAQVSYLPWANPLSVNRRLRKMGFEPKAEAYGELKSGTLNYPKNPLTCKQDKKLNLILILIESWRFDSFNAEVTPNLFDKYTKEHGYYFSNNLSGGNATQAGVFSFFYGLPSTYWGAFVSERKPPVLITQMQAEGYEPAIYASGKLNSPEFNKNIFATVENLRIDSKGVKKYDRDNDAQAEFEKFIESRDKTKTFFGFLFYDSPHGMQYPPEYEKFTPAKEMNYISLSASTDPTPYLNQYKNSVYFVDAKLKELFDFLKKQNLQDNTVIVITGDHGQEINDTKNNFWGHNSNFTKYQTRVPLLIFWPGKNGAEETYRTSHHDIMPTLVEDLLGCTNPPSDYSIGKNLFDSTLRPYSLVVSYGSRAVVEGGKISVIDSYGSMENYDDDYKKTDSVAPKAIAESFKDLSAFYK